MTHSDSDYVRLSMVEATEGQRTPGYSCSTHSRRVVGRLPGATLPLQPPIYLCFGSSCSMAVVGVADTGVNAGGASFRPPYLSCEPCGLKGKNVSSQACVYSCLCHRP